MVINLQWLFAWLLGYHQSLYFVGFGTHYVTRDSTVTIPYLYGSHDKNQNSTGKVCVQKTFSKEKPTSVIIFQSKPSTRYLIRHCHTKRISTTGLFKKFYAGFGESLMFKFKVKGSTNLCNLSVIFKLKNYLIFVSGVVVHSVCHYWLMDV